MSSDRLMMQGALQSIGGVTLYFLSALENSKITFQYDETYARRGMMSA